ncbi:MAG TPA: EAL domain-containing protein [Steroidobacteraceae bacterium]|nr:EAL domain-containing protein [Steroidobacteraceae bacterium]
MSPVPDTPDAPAEHQPFAAGWTGALAVGLFIYIAISLLLTYGEGGGGPVFEFFKLFSDFPASAGSAVLATVAARHGTDPAVRRTWAYLAATMWVYTIGNVLNSAYWLFGVDPFPSVGDVFFLGFYPLLFAAIFTAIRAAAVRIQWGRLALDATILMLGFGAFFWFFVIGPASAADRDPDVIKYVLTQTYIALNCLVLLAFGILLMHGGAGAIARRTLILLTIGFATMQLADLVWAMAKITGSYLPGGMSDAIYLSCYAALIAAAREQLRGPAAPRREVTAVGSALVQGMPYVAMLVSFLVLVYVESSSMSSPATAMTVIIFALTLLVMLRQGVISRDDALLRERRAAGMVEARYASLIRNASDVIMIADVDGRLRFASPAAERTFGVHPDELAGRNLLDLWADGDRERLVAFLAEVAVTRGRTVGPVEVTVGNGTRRSTLESVGSNLLDDPAIAGLALNFRDVSERKALEEQLRQLAFHDPLTLLANRFLFRNRVQHALALAQRTRQRVAVMFLDLDNFKNVNDSLGHDAGDRLLQACAQRLVKSTRPSDTVARLGGDEFAILLEGISEEADVERVAATITRSFDEPLQLDGSDTWMAASIGIAFSEPDDDTEQLLRNADIAMYNAKAAGKARFVVFQPRMQEQLRERLRLEEDINRALERGEFFLEYQPVVDLSRREILGVEALVRWNHPEQGLVMPGAFIPTAEESGQIVELGRWVLTEACRAVRAWRDSIAAGEGLRVAVNISGRHLQHADLVADVRNALEVSGLEPENLVIELTESTIMHNTEVNLARFRELKALGVRLAIDDFGMGYSSLSYLHRFPIDILKIDRSFVGRLSEEGDGPELARAVVMLGETLGLETVAEGVEHEEQVAKLLALGCVAAQGFLFARSSALADVSAMPFCARRAELRNATAHAERLTATGRFNVSPSRTRSVA